MDNIENLLEFPNRQSFRLWLTENSTTSDGVWLIFNKTSGTKTKDTITANDALEEALCFGWIDGQMKSLDEEKYKKYFALRRANSKWSEKNKALATQLEKQGKMTDLGREKIAEAKKNGQWDKPQAPPIGDEEIAVVAELLKAYEPAYTNFSAMSPSVKKTYTRAYYDAKTDKVRNSRIAWMVERLNKNLKPM
jgi:uncharacterized protein YdeI (YjbR/CyaY-like superfamily)